MSVTRANPNTIHNKFLVGYQGWFTCAGDGKPLDPRHHGWLHWFNAPLNCEGSRPNTDLWPDVSAYSPSELYPTPSLNLPSGEPARLFSSRNPQSVQRHFQWMADHGIDGAFLQRFAGQCDIEKSGEAIFRLREEVGRVVKIAAEKTGRVLAIMYDVSGVDPGRIQGVIERDWMYLIHQERILDSPCCLREQGKPVVALWGFGFHERNHTPELVARICEFIRANTPGGAYIVAGIPAHWRTAESDADRNPAFKEMWLSSFDAVSPWTIGRYDTEAGADHFKETKMKGDAELINEWNRSGKGRFLVDYMPVLHPGASGYNLSQGVWRWNAAPRKGGRYFWRQIHNAVNLPGVRMIYGAMWDEYDEGTAFLPIVEKRRDLPIHEKFKFMALDEDGYELPSDWYMRICGFLAQGLRGERHIDEVFPEKELRDYWKSRGPLPGERPPPYSLEAPKTGRPAAPPQLPLHTHPGDSVAANARNDTLISSSQNHLRPSPTVTSKPPIPPHRPSLQGHTPTSPPHHPPPIPNASSRPLSTQSTPVQWPPSGWNIPGRSSGPPPPLSARPHSFSGPPPQSYPPPSAGFERPPPPSQGAWLAPGPGGLSFPAPSPQPYYPSSQPLWPAHTGSSPPGPPQYGPGQMQSPQAPGDNLYPAWQPGAGQYPPPTHPGLPGTGTSSSQAGSPTTTSGPLNSALNAVDRVAGRKARNQLDSLVQSGGRMFDKITKR